MKRFDDETLRSALRDVKVPEDLKDRLRELSAAELPIQDDAIGNSIRGHNKKLATGLALILAATFAGLVIKVFWPATVAVDPPGQIASQRKIAPVDEKGVTEAPGKLAAQKQELLRNLEDNTSMLEQFAIARKIQRLEKQLAANEKDLQRAGLFLSPDESASMVLTLAGQTAIQMGVGPEQVSRQLNDVIQRFPGTGGARLAEEILKSELN